MSLASRVTALAQAIGADIKPIRTKLGGIEEGAQKNAWDQLRAIALVSGVATLDLASPAGFRVALTANATLAFTNVPTGRVVVFTVTFVQDATGGRAVTFPASVKADGGGTVAQPALGAGAVTVQSFYTDDGGVTIWQAPADYYRRTNILGAVSQLAGVPTGAIIERGSNANGEYVRFADGTQICWAVSTAGLTINLTDRTVVWVHPASFISAPFSVLLPGRSDGLGQTDISKSVDLSTVTQSFYRFTVRSGNAAVYGGAAAIGRWFQ